MTETSPRVLRDLRHPSVKAVVAQIPSFGKGACHRIVGDLAEALTMFEPEARWRAVLGECPGIGAHSWLTADGYTIDLTPNGRINLREPKLVLGLYRYLGLSRMPPSHNDPMLPRNLSSGVREWLRKTTPSTERRSLRSLVIRVLFCLVTRRQRKAEE